MYNTIPTKMDTMSREILTNPNFDVSKITWEEFLDMCDFWLFRMANPRLPCEAWIRLVYPAGHLSRWIREVDDPSTDAGARYQKRVTFRKNSGISREEMAELIGKTPIEDFDEEAAKVQHGGWKRVNKPRN